MLKTNTKKKFPKKNDRYNLRSKGDPPTLVEVQENMRFLLRKDYPVATPNHKTKNKPGKRAIEKNMSMSSKL